MGKRKKSKQRRRTAAEPQRTDIRESGGNDSVKRLIEWQEHRYDPGYYTGGRVHPVLLSRYPNKYGYVLIVGGLLTTILMILTLRSGGITWYEFLICVPILLLMLLAGFKLIRGERRSPRKGAKKASDR